MATPPDSQIKATPEEPDILLALIRVDHLDLGEVPNDEGALSHILRLELGGTSDLFSGDDPVSAFNNRI